MFFCFDQVISDPFFTHFLRCDLGTCQIFFGFANVAQINDFVRRDFLGDTN